jgi:broad specificity phosphatase PhoE
VTTLLLVRHGETVGNSRIRYFGRTDLELSPLGRAQMAAARAWIGQRFGAARIVPVMSSPMRRARESAAIISGNPAPFEIKQFVEVDFGRFEGLTAEEIAARFPEDFARWNRDRLDPAFTYPGGENRAAFMTRVKEGIHAMLAAIDGRANPSGGDCALLVAHRGVIRIVTEELAGVAPMIELGSLQALTVDGDKRWRATILDATDYLRGLA